MRNDRSVQSALLSSPSHSTRRLEPRPEQRVAAVSFGHELLAGDFQVGLAEPGPVGGGVGAEEDSAGNELTGALGLDVADVHAGHLMTGGGQLL
jgi:hypothetical protein